MTLTSWVVLNHHKIATVFLTVYKRVELQLGSFCIFSITQIVQYTNHSSHSILEMFMVQYTRRKFESGGNLLIG